MQPLQPSVVSPPTSRQTVDTPQRPPGSIKNTQAIKSTLQKPDTKPSNESGSNPSLVGHAEINLILLSLVNQLIAQMQGVDSESLAGTAKPEISGKESTAKTETPGQPPSGEVPTSTKQSNSEKTDTPLAPAVKDNTASINQVTTTSEIKASSGEISSPDEKQISEKKPVLTNENTASVSNTPAVPEAETALEIDTALAASTINPPQVKNEGTATPDGLRSLKEFKISLIGFSDQNSDEANAIFTNKTFMNGRFHAIRDD